MQAEFDALERSALGLEDKNHIESAVRLRRLMRKKYDVELSMDRLTMWMQIVGMIDRERPQLVCAIGTVLLDGQCIGHERSLRKEMIFIFGLEGEVL